MEQTASAEVGPRWSASQQIPSAAQAHGQVRHVNKPVEVTPEYSSCERRSASREPAKQSPEQMQPETSQRGRTIAGRRGTAGRPIAGGGCPHNFEILHQCFLVWSTNWHRRRERPPLSLFPVSLHHRFSRGRDVESPDCGMCLETKVFLGLLRTPAIGH